MTAPRKISVFLADDHAILRSGLRLMIEAQHDMQVVGEAGDFRQTLHLVKSLAPDIITLDLSMPGGTGLKAIEDLRAAAPSTRILVLTMHEDAAYVRAALAVGAAGFLAKSAADSALIAAIRAVHRGRLFIDVKDAPANSSPIEANKPATDSPAPMAQLSAREREVMVLVARGHTNQAVADRLGLSVKTIESYRARLMEKLGLANRAELTQLAVELGLLGDSSGEPRAD